MVREARESQKVAAIVVRIEMHSQLSCSDGPSLSFSIAQTNNCYERKCSRSRLAVDRVRDLRKRNKRLKIDIEGQDKIIN